MKIALVSGGDHKYFPMLREWMHGVERLKPSEFDADICIMDAGLTQADQDALTAQGAIVKTADWPAHIAPSRIRGREFLKACAARPFIRELFPDYDVYIWLDADTWVQDWSAIDLLVRGALKSGLAICPQTDRAYGKSMRLKWLGPFPFKPRSFYYSNAKKAFGGKVARSLFPYTTLNAGVFALRANAPHWKAWQSLVIKALDKGKVFTAEQLTLGMLVHLEKYSAEFLPSLCNWLLETPPVWDEASQKFVEPYLPHHPIGITHLSGCDAMRVDRSVMKTIATTEGGQITKSYRYPFFDGESAA